MFQIPLITTIYNADGIIIESQENVTVGHGYFVSFSPVDSTTITRMLQQTPLQQLSIRHPPELATPNRQFTFFYNFPDGTSPNKEISITNMWVNLPVPTTLNFERLGTLNNEFVCYYGETWER